MVYARGAMRNIQFIDGAENCPFAVFHVTDGDFRLLFPELGQDIQYAEDLPENVTIQSALARLFQNSIPKREAMGIHGTLFRGKPPYEFWYREKREDSIHPAAINEWQRLLLGTDGRKPSEPSLAPIEPERCRNIQTVDGARNCTYPIWQVSDVDFALFFPEPGQEIQSAGDIASLPQQRAVRAAGARLWQRPIRKRDAMGIHGTIFFDAELERYRALYSVLREDGFHHAALTTAQRRLYGLT